MLCMEDRVILVDKPAGMSSFGVVARVRRRLRDELGHRVKVGHTGTLDPFATGLLILLSGKMTKKSGEFLKLDKVYEATAVLGCTSSTGDPEGEIRDHRSKMPDNFDYSGIPKDMRPFIYAQVVPARKEVAKALKHFEGKITQKVPIYSAVKINGERAYRLARKGCKVDMPVREVEVYKIELLEYEYPILRFRCHVSSGTYVRTLAEDIGMYLDTGAYLMELRRLKVGEYDVKDAIELSEEV